ncbi:MAG: amidohydrolase family protein, partial [Geminicoccaceae bacterium]
MQPDLILRGANLPDGRCEQDILIKDGLIQAVGPQIDARGRDELDVSGRLVTPPFVDCHFHMDATLSLGLPRLNRSGTLLEGIQLWNELKPLLTVEAVVERALAYCDMAVAQGIGAIRSHVDVCDPRLTGVEGLLEVRRLVAPYLTLQLVAFPQDGLYRSPGAREKLLRALELGVEIVGGIPHFERTMEDGRRSVVELCELAA